MRWQIALISVAMLMAAVGCFSVQEYNQTRLVQLLSRASFDLECSEDQLSTTPLHTLTSGNFEGTHTAYGVTGCDRRAVYVYAPGASAWVMNTIDGNVAARPQTHSNETE